MIKASIVHLSPQLCTIFGIFASLSYFPVCFQGFHFLLVHFLTKGTWKSVLFLRNRLTQIVNQKSSWANNHYYVSFSQSWVVLQITTFLFKNTLSEKKHNFSENTHPLLICTWFLKNQVHQSGLLAGKSQFWNWFLQATQAIKIQFEID